MVMAMQELILEILQRSRTPLWQAFRLLRTLQYRLHPTPLTRELDRSAYEEV